MSYRQRIKEIRIKYGFTEKEIADVLRVSQVTYIRYETGETKIPIKHIITLCQHYNVSADYILGFTNEPETD